MSPWQYAIPAGLVLATTIAGASLKQTMADEHRITASETAETYLAKSLDATLARQLTLEQKFDNMIASLGRIEGALAERNRAETAPSVTLPTQSRKR